MKLYRAKKDPQNGGVRGALLFWLLGVPLPIVLLVFFFGGC